MTRNLKFAFVLGCAAISACHDGPSAVTDGDAYPVRADQPLNPVDTAARIATINAAAATGNQKVAEREFGALHADMMRSMRLPDATRKIAPEAARAVALNHTGVRGAAWVDSQNLLVRVAGPEYKTFSTIDSLCKQLEPLGDTLWVTLNLQDVTANSGDPVNTLTRNCQLAPGERNLVEQPRKMDVIDPSLRAKHAEDNARVMRGESRTSRDYSSGDKAAIEAIPEFDSK